MGSEKEREAPDGVRGVRQLPQGGESPLGGGLRGDVEEEAVTRGLASLAPEVPTLAELGFKGARRAL